MKETLNKIFYVLVISVFPGIAAYLANLIEELLFKTALGWEGSHGLIVLFLLITALSYISFNNFSKNPGALTVWIGLIFFLLLSAVSFIQTENIVKLALELLPGALTIILGYLAGYILFRKRANRFWIAMALGVLPLIFSLGVKDLWAHRIEYGNWTGNLAHPEVISFSFTNKSDVIVNNASLQGKIVMFDFWFINCGPCWAKFPKLQELHEKYENKSGVEIFAVNRPMKGDKPGALFSTIEEKQYTFAVLRGTQEDMDALGVHRYPTVMLLNRKGEIIFIGELDQAEKRIESLLQNE